MKSITPHVHYSIDPIVNLVEEHAISKLQNYYVMALDSRNFAGFSQVFTKDVVADYGPGIGELHGLEALSVTLNQMTAPVQAQHTIGSQLISIQPPASGGSPTHATSITYVVANQFGKGDKEGKALYAYPRYEDKLVETSEGWRITERKLVYMGSHMGDISIFGL